MTAPACIGQPVSWLRLERLALGELAPTAAAEVRAHLAACPACAAALARITDDQRPLPRLLAAVAPARVRWWRRPAAWCGGAAVVAAAAAAVALVPTAGERARPGSAAAVVHTKGAGAVAITLVRERGGAIGFDPDDVAPGDRWKIELSCAPGPVAWVDVAVIQGPAIAFPLPAQAVTCGNRVVVPGAFRITGGAAEVCVAIAEAAPDRARLRAGARDQTACRRLRGRAGG